MTMAPKITLYYMPVSPASRSVVLVAKTLNIQLDLREIDISRGEHMTPEFLKLNPQHTLPALDDNGTVIIDSHAINAYLCDKFAPNHSLYPKDLVKRAQINSRLHFDTTLYARIRYLYEPIYEGSSKMPANNITLVTKCWDILEAFLANGNFLCGNELTLADFACICNFYAINSFAPVDRRNHAKLIRWIQRMGEIPHFYKVVDLEESKAHQRYIRYLMETNSTF
ncbi:Glutathione S-transferase D4 [Pseudolycoriella hygida]|uniref:glutathione transferase n=1 Tax=Pseudolycoriella hygida TaxID=35572 RepID=A0A9Q0N2F9_9DIPT|nr:Glutathione S-transferase D4 [Pseudolycoriella hygida]